MGIYMEYSTVYQLAEILSLPSLCLKHKCLWCWRINKLINHLTLLDYKVEVGFEKVDAFVRPWKEFDTGVLQLFPVRQ